MQRQRSLFSSLLFLFILFALNHSLSATDFASLVYSSVKLCVDDQHGHSSWGTGTIIDTREGKALILTCGHIFRDSQGKGNVEVHLFGEHSSVTVLGNCLFYDLDVDLALIAIAPPFPVQAVRIAPDFYTIQPSQQAMSVGCDHGRNPTVRKHEILSTDRIREQKESGVSFHYVQVSGAPVAGRSGGGLFSTDGYLIGVCNTAGTDANDGHFVPPHMIKYILDKVDLAHIYHNPSLGETHIASEPAALPSLNPIDQPTRASTIGAAMSIPMPKTANAYDVGKEQHETLSKEEQATLEEITRRKQNGDEIILIVRSRRNPEIPSEVVFLNDPSEQFLDALGKIPSVQSASSLPPPSIPLVNSPIIFSSSGSERPDRQPVSFSVQH